MTTFPFRLPLLLVSLAGICGAASAAGGSPPKADECSSISPMVERRCVGIRLERKDRELTRLYPHAIAAVRRSFAKYGESDARADPKYLERSQAAWTGFVKNDCTVRSAFGGGSNMSISERYLDCYEAELDKRIEFLRQLSTGSYGL